MYIALVNLQDLTTLIQIVFEFESFEVPNLCFALQWDGDRPNFVFLFHLVAMR